MFKDYISKFAFTLAEVLIVLGIIGIIADMTIPNLKRDIDKIVYVTQLKKFYSTFQQGMQMIMVTEGVFNLDATSLFTNSFLTQEGQDSLDVAIKKTFNTIKSCKFGITDCKITGYKGLNKIATNTFTFIGLSYVFYTADGMAVDVYLYNCKNGACGRVKVDINGAKKPNIIGRDYFEFVLAQDGALYPYGSQKAVEMNNPSLTTTYWKDVQPNGCGTEGSSNITSETVGEYCAARIMEEGWKMNY